MEPSCVASDIIHKFCNLKSMAEGSEYSLSRRDAILQWMHNVQKATSSDKTEVCYMYV